ncbi:MAG: hypothetical protein U0269_05975 [Polyangiales bacterium]
MNQPTAVRTASLAAAALVLLPTAAHASGGWEGVGTLLGLLAVPLLFIVMVAQVIVLALKKVQRVTGIVTVVLGALGMLWQLFWYSLEAAVENRPVGFMAVGILINVIALALAVRLIRSKPAPAAP